MSERQPLTTFGLTARLVTDFAILGFASRLLASDLGNRDRWWAVFDAVCLALFTWLTFVDVHNWKDPSPRFMPVRRPRP
jgi:hypothetical protein